MTESAPHFVTLTIILFILALLVFAMKYGVQLVRTRADAARASDTDAQLAVLHEKTRDIDARLVRIETLLKEVE